MFPFQRNIPQHYKTLDLMWKFVFPDVKPTAVFFVVSFFMVTESASQCRNFSISKQWGFYLYPLHVQKYFFLAFLRLFIRKISASFSPRFCISLSFHSDRFLIPLISTLESNRFLVPFFRLLVHAMRTVFSNSR